MMCCGYKHTDYVLWLHVLRTSHTQATELAERLVGVNTKLEEDLITLDDQMQVAKSVVDEVGKALKRARTHSALYGAATASTVSQRQQQQQQQPAMSVQQSDTVVTTPRSSSGGWVFAKLFGGRQSSG
jgi:signal recognition particle GTPase